MHGSSDNAPTVSVIMPLYNAERYVAESVRSILDQSMGDLELIVVNDGSTDTSREIVRHFDDPRLVHLDQSNAGEAAAFNAGLEVARGRFVIRQDADDVSMPNRLEMLLSRFTSDDIGFVHSDMMLIDSEGEPLGYWQASQISREQLLAHLVRVGTPFNNASMLIRREALADVAADTSIRIGLDTDVVARFAIHWQGVHVPAPLLLYRRHSLNVTNDAYTFQDVKLLLGRHAPTELVPEASWEGGTETEIAAIAESVVALMLLRRGDTPDGEEWLARAADRVDDMRQDVTRLVAAIGNLGAGNAQYALQMLEGADGPQAMVENYRGEALALCGHRRAALEHFTKAITLAPNYAEALVNVRALGGGEYNVIDSSFRRFN